MEKRRLGKTNAMVSIVNIGGCGPGFAKDQEEADKAVQLALDSGVNMVDCAPSYGEAEMRLRPWMETHRDELFLAEKTQMRTKEEALEEMQSSMKKLGVDKFDLYQFHAVPSIEVLNQILGAGGAMEAFEEAKESDMIEYIGITGHDDIEVFIEALKRYDFDTVLAPISVAHEVNPHPTNDFKPLLDLARERDVGIQAIKAIAKRRWNKEDRSHKTWYEPLDEQNAINQSLWYTLSQNGVTTAPMSCDVSLWPMILQAANNYSKLTLMEINEVINQAKLREMWPLFPMNA